ncbi:hypothetical protein FRB97_006909 [Tulasnella sp. 331]|nr:hypothetical protein FRB97_006909 [Tulasnella sp. 331]
MASSSPSPSKPHEPVNPTLSQKQAASSSSSHPSVSNPNKPLISLQRRPSSVAHLSLNNYPASAQQPSTTTHRRRSYQPGLRSSALGTPSTNQKITRSGSEVPILDKAA